MPKIPNFDGFLQESQDFVDSLTSESLKRVEDLSKSLTSLKKTQSLGGLKISNIQNVSKNETNKSLIIEIDTSAISVLEERISSGHLFVIYPYWSEDYCGIRMDFSPEVQKGKAKLISDIILNYRPGKFFAEYNSDSEESLASSIDDAFLQITSLISKIRIKPTINGKKMIPSEFLGPITGELNKNYVKGVNDFFWEGKEAPKEHPKLVASDLILDAIKRDPELNSYFGEVPEEVRGSILSSEEFRNLKNEELKKSLERQDKAQKILKFL